MNGTWKVAMTGRSRRAFFVGLSSVLVPAAIFMAVKARAAGVPATNAMVYSGYLETAAGKPMTDPVDVELQVWDDLTSGKKVCALPSQKVTPNNGHFDVTLPDDCTAAVSASPDLWLEPIIGGTSLGRSKLGAVPYAVEAGHAAHAGIAEAAGGDLAAQLTAMQGQLDALKGRLDGSLSSALSAVQTSRVDVTAASKDWTWISGTDATKLAPGRYWVFNTVRVYSTAAGCSTNCTAVALVFLAACQKVGDKLTVSKGNTVAEAPKAAGVLASLPGAANDYFDFAQETDGVQLGLCARGPGDATMFDVAVANAYSLVMPQLK